MRGIATCGPRKLCNGCSVCDECGVDSSHPPGTALPPLPHAPGRCDNRKGRSQSGFGLSLSQARMVGLPKRLQFCCRVQNKRRSPRPAERQCVRTRLCVLSRLIKPRPQLTLADSCLLESLLSSRTSKCMPTTLLREKQSSSSRIISGTKCCQCIRTRTRPLRLSAFRRAASARRLAVLFAIRCVVGRLLYP